MAFYTEGKRIMLSQHLSSVLEFRFKFWIESRKNPDGSLSFHKALGNMELMDGTKLNIRFELSDFYRRDAMRSEYKKSHFHLLKAGKLAYVAEEEISLLTENELIMEGINDHRQSCRLLPEGTPVMVLKTLMFDTIPLAKVLYGEEIGWRYGVLYDKDTFDTIDNENHWI
jgi:hypothetical protein